MSKAMRFFAGVTLDEDSNSKWIEILKTGTFDQLDGSGPFEVTKENLHNAIEAADKKFFQHGADMPIFLGHQVMHDPIARITEERQGGISQLKVEGNKLLGFATFTDDMAGKIKQKKYVGISAEFDSNLHIETGEPIGFGLQAAGITNTPFLGQAPISLSVPAAQEDSMTQTASEQKLMALTGATTPETACAQVETIQGENTALKADNEKLLAENNTMRDGLENQKALSSINKAIAENKPVAGMVQGYDAEPTDDNPHPALKAVNAIGGVAGAEHVFSTLTPLASLPKGADHADADPAPKSNDSDPSVGEIPQEDLTLAQARKHFCASNDIPEDKYQEGRRFFSLSEPAFLIREGYHLVEQDRPKDKE